MKNFAELTNQCSGLRHLQALALSLIELCTNTLMHTVQEAVMSHDAAAAAAAVKHTIAVTTWLHFADKQHRHTDCLTGST